MSFPGSWFPKRLLRFALPWLTLLGLVLLAIVVVRSPLQVRDDRLGVLGGPSTASLTHFLSFQADIMATVIEVQVPESPRAAALAESVFAVFREVDARMSEWKPTSPLSAVNAAAGERPIPVPADLREVVRRGIELGDLTGGAFDITWAALWGLWDFRAPEPRVPPAEEVAARVALVDYRRIVLDEEAGTVLLPDAGMRIGLGGIAKGYALDRAAAVLRREGVFDFLLLAGGQVYAGGTKGGRPWRVGVRDPRGGPSDYFAMLSVTDASVSTSGDYESYFVVDGVRYHHILDPRTGMPARGLRSVTVVSPDATLADALSTAMMVMGKAAALALADSLPQVQVATVDDAGIFETTPGLTGKIEVLRPPRP